jgi:biotin carboxyl carrier protein
VYLTNEDVQDILHLLDALPYGEFHLRTESFQLHLRRTADGAWTQATQVLSEPQILQPERQAPRSEPQAPRSAPTPAIPASPATPATPETTPATPHTETTHGAAVVSGGAGASAAVVSGGAGGGGAGAGAAGASAAVVSGGTGAGGAGASAAVVSGGAGAGGAGAGGAGASAAVVSGGAGAGGAGAPGAEPRDGLAEVRSPLPGTFYRAPKPGAPPFVEVGVQVSEDTVVGIIETMKLMNSVSAGIRGTIAEICLADAEFAGQDAVLMRIERS